MTMDQLTHLAKPFPDSIIHQRPQGGRNVDYVAHADVVAKLLVVCGPYDYNVEHVTADTWKVTITVEVDGRSTTVSGVSTDEEPETAESRAFCRAAMRLGVGQHLWAQNKHLYGQLSKEHAPNPSDSGLTPVEAWTQGKESVRGIRQTELATRAMAQVEADIDRVTEEREERADLAPEHDDEAS